MNNKDDRYLINWNLRVPKSLDDMLEYYIRKMRLKKSTFIRQAVIDKITQLRKDEIKKEVEEDLG